MARRWMIATVLASLLSIAIVLPVLGGGSATVTLDDPAIELTEGEPTTISFTLLQHGVTPTDWTTTFVTATSETTGETVRFDAIPDGDVGHWAVDVTLPSSGVWQWEIQTEELHVVTEFEPLTVAAAAGSVNSTSGVSPAQIQIAVDDAVATEMQRYEEQLSSLTGQVDVLGTQVGELTTERDTLLGQITSLETAVAQSTADADESGGSWWVAAIAGAAGATAIGATAYAVIRWRSTITRRDSRTPVPVS